MTRAKSPDHPKHTTRPPVVVVTGPTSAGKSSLAVLLAERFDGEVVNADSMQVYRYMDIGTAKPSLEVRSRVPHHLFDEVAPNEVYSAGRYAEGAREAAALIHSRGHPVLLTGGTGLYIRAFLHGLVDTGAADPELRESLEQEHERAQQAGDPTRLHRRLQEEDPKTAAKLHPNDARRIIRALEILEQGGVAASEVRRRHGFPASPYRVLHLAIDPGREALTDRIDAYCKEMIGQGLLQEVRALRKRGYGPELRSMQALGYRHMQPVIEGSETLEIALQSMQRDTRRFARRQRTWLRKVSDVEWMDPQRRDEIVARVESFLAEPDDDQLT
jgi:tRNA dimethylallyltransferase